MTSKQLSILNAVIWLITSVIAVFITYKIAWHEGFQACIEENNLYKNYQEGGEL